MTISHVHVMLLCTQCLYTRINSLTLFSYLLMSPCQYSCNLSSLINWFNKDAKAKHTMACKTKKLSSTATVDITTWPMGYAMKPSKPYNHNSYGLFRFLCVVTRTHCLTYIYVCVCIINDISVVYSTNNK